MSVAAWTADNRLRLDCSHLKGRRDTPDIGRWTSACAEAGPKQSRRKNTDVRLDFLSADSSVPDHPNLSLYPYLLPMLFILRSWRTFGSEKRFQTSQTRDFT